MERLNLRTPKTYDYTSESESMNPRAKFFCVSEGATEESYFQGIRNNKVNLNIKSDVVIEVVKKEEGQESYSHPEQLVKACLFAMGKVDENGNELPEKEWNNNCKWDYDVRFEHVCVIFDKDYRGLKKEDIEKLISLCEKHNIYVAISNPNFELWLLMHYPEIEQYDKEMLLRNPKNLRNELFSDASKDKKYLEILVSKASGGYSKGSKIHFERFLSGVSIAIEQAKMFCEEPRELNEKLGSAVGRLIEKMQYT